MMIRKPTSEDLFRVYFCAKLAQVEHHPWWNGMFMYEDELFYAHTSGSSMLKPALLIFRQGDWPSYGPWMLAFDANIMALCNMWARFSMGMGIVDFVNTAIGNENV